MTMDLKTMHTDPRGAIYGVALPTGQELLLFFCNRGFLRGGHSHSVPEVVAVVSGHLRYHKMVKGEEKVFDLYPGDTMVNYPDEPHMGFFVEDTWLLEFKFGPGSAVGEWTTTEYEPMREQVRRSMA